VIFDRTWRVQRLECKIAGLKAKLTSTIQIVKSCAGEVPGAIVIDYQTLPQKIAELETRVAQLKAPNAR
jgi:hypothetical protein